MSQMLSEVMWSSLGGSLAARDPPWRLFKTQVAEEGGTAYSLEAYASQERKRNCAQQLYRLRGMQDEKTSRAVPGIARRDGLERT
jgi:hypothetical protein